MPNWLTYLNYECTHDLTSLDITREVPFENMIFEEGFINQPGIKTFDQKCCKYCFVIEILFFVSDHMYASDLDRSMAVVSGYCLVLLAFRLRSAFVNNVSCQQAHMLYMINKYRSPNELIRHIHS